MLMVLLLPLFLAPFGIMAQSIKRQCISSYNVSNASSNFIVLQTVGQPYSTTLSDRNVLQGFQQPISFKASKKNDALVNCLEIKAFPNPAKQWVTIQSSTSAEISKIQVMDITGRSIFLDNNITLEDYKLDCSKWSNGIYIITVTDFQKQKSSLKLIISK